jgi:hypothetical protein
MGALGGLRSIAGVGLVALAIALAGCGDLSREELSRGTESLSALAAQGGLLADGVARDATKATYAREMAKTLGGEAEHEAEKLADAEPEAAIEDERDAAVEVAGEIADLFSELQVFPGDERRGLLVRGQMGKAGDRAEAIVERLKETE